MALPVGFYGSLQWIGWLSLLDEVALNHWNTQMSGEKLEKHHRLSYYIAVHSDKTIAFISSMCWKMSFATNKEIVHVDYSSLKRINF